MGSRGVVRVTWVMGVTGDDGRGRREGGGRGVGEWVTGVEPRLPKVVF